ncbi:uncharacterized protein LOC135499210 [Lineus longissimus]|uniref:uncharacterized protein LOC135499210 n=1 Tax=Lineus longissimus TaxID=88925 RepID=UPI00315CCBBC
MQFRFLVRAFEHGVIDRTDSLKDRIYYLKQYTSEEPQELTAGVRGTQVTNTTPEVPLHQATSEEVVAEEPRQEAKKVDSVRMQLQLPEDKIAKIQAKCKDMAAQDQTTVRELAQLIGKLAATTKAILPGPLHYRNLQMLKRAGLRLKSQCYETTVTLNPDCKADLKWLIEQLRNHNGKATISTKPTGDFTIQCVLGVGYASLTGWGAVIETSKDVAQGRWTKEETRLHINVLELKVVEIALKSLARQAKNCHRHFRLDNSSAVAQINKLGGNKIPRPAEDHPRSMGLLYSEKHLIESRAPPRGEECGSRPSFPSIQRLQRLAPEPENLPRNRESSRLADHLFASRHNRQKQQYVSWKPDPRAITFNAFALDWGRLEAYAFPPFCLIGRCLAKVKEDKANMILTQGPKAPHSGKKAKLAKHL